MAKIYQWENYYYSFAASLVMKRITCNQVEMFYSLLSWLFGKNNSIHWNDSFSQLQK
jgi:hypothetical protein